MFRSICDLYYNQYSYWLYKDVHVNLCFIRLVDISSLLVPCVLCFRNTVGRKLSLWWAFLSVSRQVLISWQSLNIVFILQYHVFTKFLILHTKRQKYLTFGWISIWVSLAYSLLDHCLLYFALHKTQGTRRLDEFCEYMTLQYKYNIHTLSRY
jgi:hypothetical protein